MKPVIRILVLIAIIAGFTNCKKNKHDFVYDRKFVKEIKSVRRDMVVFLTTNQIPGASVAIVKDGEILYSEGMGLASKDLEVPVTRKTKFRIAGLSELFTSFIYLRLVQDGVLQPDSSIQTYFPDYPKKEYRIELNDLAYQMSGIRDPRLDEMDWRALNVSLQKGIDEFKNDPLLGKPGLYQTENMFHYNLLGAVMEKATNKRFDDLLKEYVTDTLKLSNTVIDNPLITIKGRTDFFDHNFISHVVNATFRDMRFRAPSQGILSNAEDLAIFGDAVINSDLLSDETKASMFESALLYDDIPSSMAHGWVLLTNRNGEKMYGRGGMVTGGTAAIIVYPKYNLTIAFTSNLSAGLEVTPVLDFIKYFVPQEENQ